MKTYIELSNIEKERYQTLAGKILSSCFLVYQPDCVTSKADFAFIREHIDIFKEHFDQLGYRFVYDTNRGVAGISRSDKIGHLRVLRSDAVILLILRLLYIQKIQGQIRQTEFPVVYISEIKEKCEELSLGIPQQRTFKEALDFCARYNLIDKNGCDVTENDSCVIVFPSITLAIPHANLVEMSKTANERLKAYAGGKEVSDEETE